MAPGLPERMRAAVQRGRGELVVEERPLPLPERSQVLVEVSHCGICGTDLHMVLGGMGRPGSIGGHEYAGRVVALGADVHDLAPGQAVAAAPDLRCGRCEYCARGRPALCLARPGLGGEGGFQGAFAQYVRADARQLLPIPPGLPSPVAALTEPLAVALHAITRSGVGPGQRALVTGAGPLGLLTLAALRARGVEDVTVSEPIAPRRERAHALGARALRTPESLRAPPLPFDLVEDPVDVAFDCSGRPEAMEAALAQLKRAGTLVLVGTGLRRPRFDHNRILLNELVVTGAYCYDADGCRSALALLASGALDVGLLIEPETVPLEGLLQAMQDLEAGRRVAKVMVAPGAAR